jgi:hypothetical protein
MIICSLLSHNSNNSLWHEIQSKESKDNFKHTHRSFNFVDCDSDSSINESNDVYVVEFYWPSKAKSYSCDSLKPIHKNRQEKIKFTFDVAKCDKIFDELHKASCIKMSHIVSYLDELKQKLIVGGIIPFLMLLMIVMFSINRSNRPLMKDD